MVRRVAGSDGPDLLLQAVAYSSLPGIPGIVTAETPEEQGIQLDLPNLPDFAAGPVSYLGARCRVTAIGPDVARLRFWPESEAMPPDDGGGLGMLVDQPELCSTETVGPVRV